MPASVQVGVKSAKAQYGIIVAGGQIGAIAGCTLVVGSNTFGARAILRAQFVGAQFVGAQFV